MTDGEKSDDSNALTLVGYRQPPLHSRFQPGQSGNPSGRPKGSHNIRTLFQKILKEKVSLREGTRVRKVSKAEAILRGMIVSALKGDSRSASAVLRLAEQVGELQDERTVEITRIERVIVDWNRPSEIDGELV